MGWWVGRVFSNIVNLGGGGSAYKRHEIILRNFFKNSVVYGYEFIYKRDREGKTLFFYYIYYIT